MKKGLFITIFIIGAIGLMYAPVQSISEGFCFPAHGENPNLISIENLPVEIRAFFNYEDASSNENWNWKFKVENSGIALLKNNLNNGVISQERIQGVRLPVSTGRCEFYTYDIKRNGGTFNLNLPLNESASQGVNDDGESVCVYYLTASMIEQIFSLGGKEYASVCPDLIKGRAQTAGTECAQTASCVVTIKQGEREIFAVGNEKDFCSQQKEWVNELNNGNKISPADIDSQAQQFVSDCMKSKPDNAAANQRVISTSQEFGGTPPPATQSPGAVLNNNPPRPGGLACFGQNGGISETSQPPAESCPKTFPPVKHTSAKEFNVVFPIKGESGNYHSSDCIYILQHPNQVVDIDSAAINVLANTKIDMVTACILDIRNKQSGQVCPSNCPNERNQHLSTLCTPRITKNGDPNNPPYCYVTTSQGISRCTCEGQLYIDISLSKICEA